MSIHGQEVVNNETVKLLKEIVSFMADTQAQNLAYFATLQTLLQHHPELNNLKRDLTSKIEAISSHKPTPNALVLAGLGLVEFIGRNREDI